MSIARTSDAQYKKALKGDQCPFDTAVITEINTFRAETKKMKLADQLITGQDTEIIALKGAIILSDSIVNAMRLLDESKTKMIRNKDSALSLIAIQMGALKAHDCKKTWWRRNKFWVGIAAGAISSFYIYTNIK